MAIYQYTAPDGKKYRVNAPEGATDDQVYGLVLQNFPYAGQTTQELESAKSAPTTLGDIGRATKQGLAGGLQSLTNIFGVDNAASKYLGEAQQSAFEGLSPARKEEIARRQELQERAKGDTGREISTGIGGFFEAPLQTGLQALASSVPIIAGAFIPGGQVAAGASLGARALAGARGAGGIGGLMGVGGQKGQDYEAVKQELLAQGVDPVIAEQKAQEAAAFSAQNLPRQALSGAAGALEGVFGVERILANAAKKVSTSQGASALTPPEFKQKLGAVAGSTLGEALPEAVQATVGQVGTNIALNQAGVEKDLTEGLAGTVAHDALVGSVLGLAVSPLQISNLQRQYKQSQANEQARKQAEENAKIQAAAQKAEAERAVLQKQTDEIRQQMEQQQAIALPAPSEEIPVEEVQTDPLKNPLGNIRKSEVPFDIYKQIDDYRKQAGLPKLKEYSIEDFVDAMPGVNPKAEQGLLDELITAKSGYAGEKYTAQDILNQAKLKNVDTSTKGFKDFLARTTGANALEQMSQPQLHAAFKALNNLPVSEGLNILPEGTNARRFDEKQYNKAIKGVDVLLAELGAPVDPKEVIKTIKEYTNLTEDSHAGAILDTAIKNGDVDLIKTPRYEIYDPKTGTALPSTYTSRTAARAAAAKRGLNVRQITTDAIAAPSSSVTLPEGFDIREGAFKEGEAPAGYDVLAGDEVLFKANTIEEANAKKDSFERTRAGMANSRENQITQLNNAIEASQKRLNTMEAQGKGQTTGYQKAAGKHAKLVADTQAKIAALTEEIKKFDPKVTALAVKPTGTKAIGRKGYTVFEQGQARATYPSRQAAEEGILADMDEKQLQELTQQQGRRAVGKKAQAELERRTAPKPTEGKPVSQVLEDIEVEAKAAKAKAEEVKTSPEVKAKLAQLEAELKPLLKQFGLGNINLNFVEKLVEGNGSYNESLIKIALTAKEPVRVLRHESLHALKDLGFFTPQQWSTLERMAKDQWIDKYLKSKKSDYKGKPTSRYDAYVDYYKGDMSKVIEEAIADAFADFAVNKPPAGMLATLLKRLNDFFTALRNAFRKADFQTAEDIFGQVERGELKAGKAAKGGERFSLFPEGAPLSTRAVMEDDDTAARTALGLNTKAVRGRYNNVRDIARALNDDTLTKYGAMDRKQLTDDDVVKIANAMADEVSYQLGTTAETGTGLGWYSNNYPNAVKRLQSRFPELADNKHARSVFSAIVAVTSNGEKVTKNIANAVELYSKLREGKTMVAMGNRRATALENNLRQIERLLEDHKTDFEKHLLQEITVKDMNAYLREMGEKSDGSYLADTVVPRAAIYFGPKLGAFYANLSGSEGYLTMDLWWTRSVNRMRGLLIPKATEASIEKFRDMMGQPEADRDEVAAAAIPLRNKYKDYGFTTELEHLTGGKEPSTKAAKPAWFKRAEKAAGDAYEQLLFDHNLEKMANTIYKNEYEMLEEAPFTATDRAFMYKAARNAQETLRKSGIDLTLADIQAALWYYEKRLYGKLSGVKADDIGYEEAIIAQASEGGGRARPSVVFGRGADGGIDTGRAVQRAEETGREPTDGERLSLPQVDEFFNKTDGIKEPEGVEIIRENWIGSVSGLGDRDSAYDLYRVQGGKKYMDDVQKLVRDELGESFKGYRLMSVEELEEIKAGAMGSQLASFTLRPDIAHAFANLASYRKVPKDQLRVVEMDLTPEHVVMIGHHGERELVVDYGQGYNPDAVVEASVGSYAQYNPTERLSLRDSTDPDTLSRVNQTTTARDETGYVERITKAFSGETFSEIRQKALNRYQRLAEYDKELSDRMGGVALMADASAEAGALASDLAAGVTASALGVHDRNGGIPVYANGVTKVFNDGGKIKGPVAIFAPLSKYNDPLIYQLYQFWAAAQRGSRLNEQGRPDIFTDEDLKKAQQLEKDHPEFRQIQEEWTTFNNGLVQFLVDTGVLSEGDKAKFTEFSDYIPFYRQMDGEKTIGPNLFQAISGVKKPKKLKEGTDKAPLADFLETIVRNTQSSIQMGMKNVAAQRAIGVATEIGMADRLRPNAPTGLDTVQVLENGQVVTYQVADPLFIEAVKSLNMPELPFIGLLSGPANFLRNMVTKDPGFMLANMVRDSMAAYVTSGVKMTPVADTIRNFGKAMANTSPEYEALLNAGILGGYEFSQNIEMSAETFERELKKKYEGKSTFERLLNPMTSPRALWEALEKGTTASDAATRIEVYKRTLAETNNEAEALHRALEVMNFNRKGSSAVVRIMTAAIPFLNARMQGLDVLYRAGISPTFRQLMYGDKPTDREKSVQKAFIVRGLTMAALSAMYWTLTHDDEEYKRQEQETKDNNWLIPSLGIKIPIPFEIGVIFKVIPERIMALTLGEDTNKDFMDSMARNLRSTLAIDYLPQTIKPFVETETNFSLFTRRPIVGQGLEGVAPEFQVGPGTSAVAATLGSTLGMSPMKIDHLIGGYTGTIGMYMVSALDGVMNMNTDTPNASKRFEQLPLIKRFALDPEARGTVTSYYDLKNATDEAVRTSSLLERTMNFEERSKFMQDNIRMLATKEYVLDLEKTMKEFRQAQVMIRSSRMDADAKREALLRINQAQNALTANINMVKARVM
jgi:hypothetical protein